MKTNGSVYKQRGKYKEQLERYYNLFPSDNILVLSSENFFTETAKTLKDILSFLDVDPDYRFSDIAPRQLGFNRQTVSAAVHDYLDDYFRPLNRELFDYIGKEFEWRQNSGQ